MVMAKQKNTSNDDRRDFELARAYEQYDRYNPFGLTENAVLPADRVNTYQPRTLIDQTLELLDPTPNIYTLFSQFNERYFSNKLVSVEVKWSKRMTSCAGVCSFSPRNRDCVISLSGPLLKLRPRKDLVETLLHEMIHGYLFLTNNNRDRDGHGPEFCKIMNRINKEAGTAISIYHSFHDEVKLYQTHWWRCNGPCQKRPPYFGMVRRAMNRAPGPSDYWWQAHQNNCGGIYIKVREPENKKKSPKISRRGNENKQPKGEPSITKSNKTLDDWMRTKKNIGASTTLSSSSTGTPNQPFSPVSPWAPNDYPQRTIGNPSSASLIKLGGSTNNVYGWGTGGPGRSSSTLPNSSTAGPKNEIHRKIETIGNVLGGGGVGRSNLLDKYGRSSASVVKLGKNRPSSFDMNTIEVFSSPVKKPKISETLTPTRNVLQYHPTVLYDCPVCTLPIFGNSFNDHIDECLINTNKRSPIKDKPSTIVIDGSPTNQFDGKLRAIGSPASQRHTNVNSPGMSAKENKQNIISCPTCDKIIHISKLYNHLDNNCSDETSTREIIDQRPKVEAKDIVDLTDDNPNLTKPYTCLVCNVKISGDIALTDHLEQCVQAIFNDDTFDVGNDSITEISSPKNDPAKEKFPCPICMDLVPDNLMNDHLDKCLLK